MKDSFIRNITEEKVKISDNRTEKRIELTFDTGKNDESINDKITLSGEGSLKVLIPA